MVLFTLSLACAKPAPPPAPAADPALPRLPAPVASVYTHVVGTPGDPLVAAAMAGLPWEEALAGAASGVALDLLAGKQVSTYDLRWRAVLAAYPYPVVERATARVAVGEVPQDLVTHAQERAKAGADVGLVRARDKDGDLWVLLVGDRRGELGRIPREYAVGESVGLGGATWVVSDPLGQLRPAGTSLTLDMAGEWLVQARDARGAIATMPLYVGVPTPQEAPILNDAQGASVVSQAQDLLGALWRWYGRDSAEFGTTLDAVARVRLGGVLAGSTLPAVGDQARSAGYIGVPVAGSECRATDIAACLDGIWWSPERRAVLVGDFEELGIAAEARDGQVVMALVGAG